MISKKNKAIIVIVVIALIFGITSCEQFFESDLLRSVRNTIEADSEIPTFNVIYHGNGNDGGTVPVDTNEYPAGTSVTVSDPGTLSLTSYYFSGWNTNADGSGTGYLAGVSLIMPAADVDLYAQWQTNPTYSVTYNGNGNTGGTVPVDGNDYETGETVSVLGNTGNLVKTLYIFTGWNTASNGSGIFYAPGQTFSMGTDNVSLYAQWEPTYTVTYTGNLATAGSPPVDTNRYAAGDTVTVLGNTGLLLRIDKVNPAYVFDGWELGAVTFTPGSSFTMPSQDVTLSPHWTECTIGGAGPGGGIVFYDKGVYSTFLPDPSTKWRYLEAAPYDQSSAIVWGPEGTTDTPLSDDTIGDGGHLNFNICATFGEGNYAAWICYHLELGGFDDWYLPNDAELHQLYLQRVAVGMTENSYWSANEDGPDFAWYKRFYSGDLRSDPRDYQYAARAIRLF